jgi:formiminoglutamate deiminase
VNEIWCEYAWLGGDAPEHGVVITIDAGRISALAKDVAPGDRPHRMRGLTLPGFANTHSHAFHRALRGRTHQGEGSFWTWRDEMYRLAATLDPDGYYELARAAYAEMLDAGYTVVGEFHYLHRGPTGEHYADPNAMGEAVMAAAADAGIRMTLLDTLSTYGGIAGGECQDAEGTQLRFAETPEQWTRRHAALRSGPGVRLGAAVHSVRAVDPHGIRTVGEWADAAGAPLHSHISEQPAENAQCLDLYGRTPTQVFDDAGVLGARFTAVHATHLTDDDIFRLGESRSFVTFCPTTERDLADGIGPSRRLFDAGARLTIGSDSHAVIDPFEETRAVELNARLASQVRGNHPVPALLKAATSDGYASLGWPEGGRIEVGAVADLVTVGLDSVRLEHPEPEHVLASVVFAAHPEDVTHVMVGGKWR